MKNNQSTTGQTASKITNYLVKGKLTLEERISAAAFIVGISEGAIATQFNAMKKLREVEVDTESIVEGCLNSSINEEYFRLIPLMEDHDFGMSTISERDMNAEKDAAQPKDDEKSDGQKEFQGSADSKDNPFQKKGESRPLAKGLRAKGMTQDELANVAGVNKSTISRIKLGVRKPSFELMQTLAKAGFDVSALFPELS